MTLETFLEKLEQTPRDWALDAGEYLRRADGSQCPISSLKDKEAWQYFPVADELGLSQSLRYRILAAADEEPLWFQFRRKRLRAKLLKACGLEAQS